MFSAPAWSQVAEDTRSGDRLESSRTDDSDLPLSPGPASRPTTLPSGDASAPDAGPQRRAEDRPALAAWAGAWVDAWSAESAGLHGWLVAGMQARLTHIELLAELNTDTLTLRLDVPVDRVRAATWVRGEVLVAAVLSDGVVAGEPVEGAGFQASYLALGQDVHVWLGGPHTIGLEASARKVFAGRADTTDPALVLPDDPWVGHALARYSLWARTGRPIAAVRSEPWALVEGVGATVELGARFTTQRRAWGALQRDVTAADPRNAPSASGVLMRAEIVAGRWVGRRLGLDARVRAGWLAGADDLEREFSAGLSPFGLPLGGRAWGSVRADRWVSGSAALRVRCTRHVAVGGFTQITGSADVVRSQSETWGVGVDAGPAFEVSTRSWHADLRLAVSPVSPWAGQRVGWAAVGGFAWRLPSRD